MCAPMIPSRSMLRVSLTIPFVSLISLLFHTLVYLLRVSDS